MGVKMKMLEPSMTILRFRDMSSLWQWYQDYFILYRIRWDLWLPTLFISECQTHQEDCQVPLFWSDKKGKITQLGRGNSWSMSCTNSLPQLLFINPKPSLCCGPSVGKYMSERTCKSDLREELDSVILWNGMCPSPFKDLCLFNVSCEPSHLNDQTHSTTPTTEELCIKTPEK